jgi:(1->4)-alpha-D-glucan 1-alpha-D-glucosylmutase
VAQAGVLNSLTQLILKCASPGICDFYQGTELWDLNLVDPDNRRPVDFQKRIRLLKEMDLAQRPVAIRDLLQNWKDGRIKFLITTLSLRFRKSHPDLMQKGSYRPLVVHGEMTEHVIAFARHFENDHLAVMVPRLMACFDVNSNPFRRTRVQLPMDWPSKGCRNIFTGEKLRIKATAESKEIVLSEAYATLPEAWLVPDDADWATMA